LRESCLTGKVFQPDRNRGERCHVTEDMTEGKQKAREEGEEGRGESVAASRQAI